MRVKLLVDDKLEPHSTEVLVSRHLPVLQCFVTKKVLRIHKVVPGFIVSLRLSYHYR